MIAYRNRFIIGIIFILAGCFIIIGFLIVPNIEGIKKINEEISLEKEDLEKKASLGLNIRQISADISEIEKKIGSLNKMFIKFGNELEFLTTLDNLSQKNKVKAQVIPKFSDRAPEKPTKIPLNITISGERNNVINYIYNIDVLPYYFIIDSVEIQDNQGSLSASLSGHVYINK